MAAGSIRITTCSSVLTGTGSVIVITPLQGRTIVPLIGWLALTAVGRRWLAALSVVGRLGAPQGGFVVVLLRDHLLAVFQIAKPGLYIVELGGIDDVFRARRKNVPDLLLALLNAVGRLRMGGEGLGQRSGLRSSPAP